MSSSDPEGFYDSYEDEDENDEGQDFYEMEDDDMTSADMMESDEIESGFGEYGADSQEEHAIRYTSVIPDSIRGLLQEKAEKVAGVLGMHVQQASVALTRFKWHEDLLLEEYLENPVKIMDKVGVYHEPNEDTPIEHNKKGGVRDAAKGEMCPVCCSDDVSQLVAVDCGHFCCVDCFKRYLSMKICETIGDFTLSTTCWQCKTVVTEDQVKYIVSEKDVAKFLRKNLLWFVESNPHLKNCPFPDCEEIVKCVGTNESSRQLQLASIVKCAKNHTFCFACSEENHSPCPCLLTKKWIKKCRDDSETDNWLSANTKDCPNPNCLNHIEKNGGCLHMTCFACHFEFCWICLGDWKLHQNNYNCSRYDPEETAKTVQSEARSELRRYLFYFDRYNNHRLSLNLDAGTFEKLDNKIRDLQVKVGMSWIETQFLQNSISVLREARRTLMWSYAFVYYLKKTNNSYIFEDNQQDLQMAVENLSEIFESKADDIAAKKLEFLDRTAYVQQRQQKLVEHCNKGLINNTWEYNIELK